MFLLTIFIYTFFLILEMGNKKRGKKNQSKWFYVIIGILIITISIFIVSAVVDKTKAWHLSNEVIVSFGNCKVTLKDAVSKGYLNGTATPTNCLSTFPSVYHSADKILITVNNNAMTLQEAVDNQVFLGKAGGSYTKQLPAGGHFGSEIEVNIGGTTKSLQGAIDQKSYDIFCAKCPTEIMCYPTGYNINCVTSGVYLMDGTCSGWSFRPKGTDCALIVSSSGLVISKACDENGNCLGWAGEDCKSCPWGYKKYTCSSPCGTTYCYYCNLQGNQGRYLVKISPDNPAGYWTDWSYETKAAQCSYSYCSVRDEHGGCDVCSGAYNRWGIKP
jgi:hypothetical protein